jgi:hypothetical protein
MTGECSKADDRLDGAASAAQDRTFVAGHLFSRGRVLVPESHASEVAVISRLAIKREADSADGRIPRASEGSLEARSRHYGVLPRGREKGIHIMKSKRILGFAVVAAVLALAASASSAFALTAQWLVGGATTSTAVTTDSLGNITLEEMNTGLAVTCEETLDKGTVGPGAADTVTSVTFNKCKSVKGCENVESVTAAGLPWTTELTSEEPKAGEEIFKDLIVKGGYTVKCRVLGIPFSSTCTKEDSFAVIDNLASTVEALFVTEEEATCTSSGKATGLVHGSESILTESGSALAASLA